MDAKRTIIIFAVSVLVGFAIGCILFGGNLHNNGNRIDTAREQLERISEYQQSVGESIDTIRDGLDDSIGTTVRIEDRVDAIEGRVEGIEESVARVI